MEFFTLENKNGLKLKVTNYGGIVSEIHVPDRDGVFGDVALGFDTVEEYVENNNAYFGAVIGRFGNRIERGVFTLDGVAYDALASNDGVNHLHGGVKGFDKVVWDAEQSNGTGEASLTLRYRSADGEEGYPGNLDATVKYTLTDRNEWVIDYEATCDKATVYNPTNHTYFNLAGHAASTALEHELKLNASFYTVGDDGGIPTGEIRPVARSSFDFTSAKTIGQSVDSDEEQIEGRGGYDHNFVIDKKPGELALAAVVWDPASGREMKVFTTEPGVQFYSANFLDGSLKGKGGVAYQRRAAFCLETQHFPNSPNVGHFPCVTLRPDRVFRSRTVYAFGTR